MAWVDRMLSATGRQPLGLSIDWEAVEDRLGTGLPADYKEYCEAFGHGHFDDFLSIHTAVGGTDSELVSTYEFHWRFSRTSPDSAAYYEPQGLFRPGVRSGLLFWGDSEQADQFTWLADPSSSPDSWPVLAYDDARHTQAFDMSMTEFLGRLTTDISFPGWGGYGATAVGPRFSPLD